MKHSAQRGLSIIARLVIIVAFLLAGGGWVASPSHAAQAKQGKAKASKTKAKRSRNAQRIVVLVNDEPISRYDIRQRARLKLLGSKAVQRRFKSMIRAPGINERFKKYAQSRGAKTKADVRRLQKDFIAVIRRRAVAAARPSVEKNALDDLIDERLKIQAAKKLGIAPNEDRVTKILTSIAKRNKMSLKQFGTMMQRQGTSIEVMRQKFRADLVWRAAVKRKFGRQVSVGTRDLERMMSVTGSIGPADTTELQLQKITLRLPGKVDQRLIAVRFQEAEKLRRKFSGCKTLARLAGSVKNAGFQKLGARRPSSMPEPTRTLLLNARDGEMLPPQLGPKGIELYTVCSRRTVAVDDRKRAVAKQRLRQREFERIAKRYLKDLRQDAHIERR